MKQLTRYLSLFLCFVLLLTVYSLPVNASDETTETDGVIDVDYKVTQKAYFTQRNAEYFPYTYTFTPKNGILESKELPHLIERTFVNYQYWNVYIFEEKNGNVLALGGRELKVKLNRVYFSLLVDNSGYQRVPTFSRALIKYIDGTEEYLDEITVYQDVSTPHAEIEFSFTPHQDVLSIEVQLQRQMSLTAGSIVTCYHGEIGGDDTHILTIERRSEEAGLLDGILGWVQNIFNKIQSLVTYVMELPQKIWDIFSNGLKSLFVPSEEYISQFKEDMDGMLSEKLGAVYQVVDILTDSWSQFEESITTSIIKFPSVTIPLPGGNEFTFGGQNVKIVPAGFNFLANSCKLASGVVCTILFINGLKRRYDEIFGGGNL